MSMVEKRLFSLSLLGILIVSFILSYLTIFNGHPWGDDFSLYIKQAKSIVEGNIRECISTTSYTVNNSSMLYGVDVVPWGYPFLLSPIYYFFGLNLLAMKYLNIVIFMLIIIMIFMLFKNKFDNIYALFITAIFAFNPYLLEFNNAILGDFSFLLFSLISIFFIERIILEEKMFFNKTFSFFILGFTISFTYFIRSMAITLIFTLIACQLIKNRRSIRYNFISFIISNRFNFIPYLILAFFILSSLSIFPTGETNHFSFIYKIYKFNLIEKIKQTIYYIELPSEFFGVQLSKIIYGITIPFFIYGLVRNLRKDYHYIIYSIANLSILTIWHSTNGLRYIFTILPFYIYFLFIGLTNWPFRLMLSDKLLNHERKFGYAFSGILIFLILAQSMVGAYTRTVERKMGKIIDGPFTKESTEMFNFISKNTHNEDVIIFRKPRVLDLLTGRKSIVINKIEQLDRGNYVVIEKTMANQSSIDISSDSTFPQVADNYLKNNSRLFNLVFENSKFKIYYIKK